MDCVELPSVCLRINDPTPSCSSQCQRCAFTLDLHANASEQRERIKRDLREVHDPLNYFRLRHIENCARLSTRQQETFVRGPISTMIWVTWEEGFADQLLRSILPVAHAMRTQNWSAPLMISGTLFPRIWTALGVPVCTFEREVAGIARCATECYDRIRLCRTIDVFGRKAYSAHSFFANRVAPPTTVVVPGISSQYKRLRVIFAHRRPVNPQHTRSILNARELIAYCNVMRKVHGWNVSCSGAYLADLRLLDAITLVRQNDVFVCMNGGDCAHGMHLARGRTVVETIPRGFEMAPDGWLNLYKSRMIPVLRHRRVILCDNSTGLRRYNDAWNVPGIFPLTLFRRVIQSIVSKRPQKIFECLR